ncbi:MAG: hypothetical protein GX574_10665 [Lentisphaerae bacterium]|nr:hypothetical protein [Lentisphaerota bacterium]
MHSCQMSIAALMLMAAAPSVFARITPGMIEASKIEYPATLTYAVSNPQGYPKVFHAAGAIQARRQECATSSMLTSFLEGRVRHVAAVIDMDDEQLRALVPPVGQPVVYGLGMSLDPHNTVLRWAGYKNPRCVIGKDNVVYPNETHPDDGSGWSGPGNQKCYFRARAAGFAYGWLESQLAALADCYALTGEQRYAHAAAVLLDAIAPCYAADVRGPLDYPIAKGDEDCGGRLDRPYYQVARGLKNYVWCFEAIMPSGELGKPSLTAPGNTMFDNVAKNLLFNGGIYCLGFALGGTQLHNGHADYVRGTAAVGIALGIPKMVEPLLDKALGLQAMLDVNIDRDGFYVESSHGYSQHTLSLYMDLADLLDAAARQGIPGAEPLYDEPAFFNLIFRYFDRAEVGGRLPEVGDGGPDRLATIPTNLRAPVTGKSTKNTALDKQLRDAWYLWSRVRKPEYKQRCAEFLRAAYGDNPDVPAYSFLLYRISQDDVEALAATPAPADYFAGESVLYGGKGYAILRGGTPSASHGLQLLFGALHNHSQAECLSWVFYNLGAEWSYDPGYFNTHYRFGWTSISVSHQQVTFNAKSAIPSGDGEILAWQPEGSAQYVFAKHPYSYAREGAIRNERLLGQADAPDGSLDYWIDISIAQGGEFRDDSYHCVMSKMETQLEFTPMNQFALGGDRFKGQHFLPDYRLSGETDKAFYWTPEGDGYNLLIKPAKAIAPADNSTLRFRFTNAIFAGPASLRQAIAVDFPGESNREYYQAESMPVRGADSVPYILRRDHGAEVSVFAKVIHFADEDAASTKVLAVKTVPVKPGGQGVRAYMIELSDGRKDCWFVGDGAAHTFHGLQSSAQVAVWRYQADGSLSEHHSSGAAKAGRVSDVCEKNGKIQLTVQWDEGVADDVQAAKALISCGAGRPGSWSIDSIQGDVIMLNAAKTHLGRVEFTPIGENTYTLRPESGFFYGRGGRWDNANFQGRHIVDEAGNAVARGVDFCDRTNGLFTVTLSTQIPKGFYTITEIAKGDTFKVLVNR